MKKKGIMADPLTGQGDCIDMSKEHEPYLPHQCSCQRNIIPLLDRIRVLEATIVKNCELCKWRKCEQCPTKPILDSIDSVHVTLEDYPWANVLGVDIVISKKNSRIVKSPGSPYVQCSWGCRFDDGENTPGLIRDRFYLKDIDDPSKCPICHRTESRDDVKQESER